MHQTEEETYFVDVYHYSREIEDKSIGIDKHYALVVEYFEDEGKSQLAFPNIFEAGRDENHKLEATHYDLQASHLTKSKWVVQKISPEELNNLKELSLSRLEDFTKLINKRQQEYSLRYCNCQTHVAELMFYLRIQRNTIKACKLRILQLRLHQALFKWLYLSHYYTLLYRKNVNLTY